LKEWTSYVVHLEYSGSVTGPGA